MHILIIIISLNIFLFYFINIRISSFKYKHTSDHYIVHINNTILYNISIIIIFLLVFFNNFLIPDACIYIFLSTYIKLGILFILKFYSLLIYYI